MTDPDLAARVSTSQPAGALRGDTTGCDLTLIQLSDPHIDLGQPSRLANVQLALDRVLDAGRPVAALVLSGDLTDSGDPAAYRALRAVVEPAAEQLGAPLVYAMGNHDERTAFRRELVDGSGSEPYDHVVRVGGLRIVVLDSTVPGRPQGLLTPGQLGWLAAELAEPAPLGTVLVLHHPPVPTAFAPMRSVDLQNPRDLAAVLTGTDVRMILCGHAHHAGASALAGIPVWIAPATAHRAELLSPAGRARGRAGTALTRVDVYPDAVVAAAEPLDEADLLMDTDERALAEAMRAAATR